MVQYSYDAFGETTISGKQAKKTENTYQFNGESTDKVTGLQYLRARYYDLTTGRFITEDTYAGDISDPLTINKYLYTNNDPVNYIDPSGHFWKELWEYGKATVKTIGDIGNAVWNFIQNPTQQNFITQAVSTVSKVSSNYSTAKNNVKNYNNSKSSKGSTSKRNQIVIKQGPPVPNGKNTNTSYTRPTYGAAVNSKVEKSREIENQIKLLRRQNTAEANRMANYLQANMKKLCENGLNKVSLQETVVINSGDVMSNIMLFSKKRTARRDTGLSDLSDEEISRRARDKSLPGEERRRYQTEEKVRGLRNKQKRESKIEINEDEIIALGGTVIGGYAAYRIIRMLPSLIPGLWVTIPANIAIP